MNINEINPESFYLGMRPPDGGIFDQGEAEEKHCPKCGDLVEECQCDYYDKIKESEI